MSIKTPVIYDHAFDLIEDDCCNNIAHDVCPIVGEEIVRRINEHGALTARVKELEAHNEALKAELERQVTGLLTLIELELIPEAFYESAEIEVANCRAAIAKA
ncbi:MAG: hypothetical protein GY776_19865 [Alteromonas sp.]|nr:hypothetical protein [Alteromonas sp.]